MSSDVDGPPAEGGCFKMRIIEYHDFKTLMGPCFISFSIPLLIPGVVLTVVGSYGNENIFPTFGGWHIAGIVILTFAVIMLFAGIVLKCCYKPIISADIEEHLTPSPSMITGNKNLGYEDENLGSNSSKLNNKIGHHDQPHRVVSTHEKKEYNSRQRQTDEHFVANGLETLDKSRPSATDTKHVNTKPHIPEVSNKEHDTREGTSKDVVKKDDVPSGNAQSGFPDVPPPGYFDTQASHKKKKHRKSQKGTGDGVVSVTESPDGDSGIHTTVTASVTANVVTMATVATNDQSSDAAENSSFLPEVKRRKKKKRKRQHSNQSVSKSFTEGSDSELTARSKDELPELRTAPHSKRRTADNTDGAIVMDTQLNDNEIPRPVLVHDGHHHHHDLHVHFRSTPEMASTPSPECGHNQEGTGEAFV